MLPIQLLLFFVVAAFAAAGLIVTIVLAIVTIVFGRRRPMLRVLAIVYLAVLAGSVVHDGIQERAYDRAFAACVERAKVYVPNVLPSAWCQP